MKNLLASTTLVLTQATLGLSLCLETDRTPGMHEEELDAVTVKQSHAPIQCYGRCPHSAGGELPCSVPL